MPLRVLRGFCTQMSLSFSTLVKHSAIISMNFKPVTLSVSSDIPKIQIFVYYMVFLKFSTFSFFFFGHTMCFPSSVFYLRYSSAPPSLWQRHSNVFLIQHTDFFLFLIFPLDFLAVTIPLLNFSSISCIDFFIALTCFCVLFT